jgi:hypothetical protein
MLTFVVLHHELPADDSRPSHWDFMIQRGDGLQTWALPQPPDAPGSMVAERLVDHRLEYLRYEGPISGGRGRVTRWDDGTYRAELVGPMRLELAVHGRRLSGLVVLTCAEGDYRNWRFEFSASRCGGAA